MEKILIKAKAGCVVPRQNPSEPYITDSEPVEVNYNERTRRLIADGSYVRVEQPKPKKEKA